MTERAPNSRDAPAETGLLRKLKDRARRHARRIGAETYTLYVAAQDPRTPWYARWLAAFVVAYALSPVDLIPDFIPVIGYLDDLVLVPIGLAVAIWLIPKAVWQDSRARAIEMVRPTPAAARSVIVVIVSTWLAFAVFAVWLGLALLSA